MLDLNAEPAFEWDEIGEWEGPAHELDYDMVWSGSGNFISSFQSALPIVTSEDHNVCTYTDHDDEESLDHGDAAASIDAQEGGGVVADQDSGPADESMFQFMPPLVLSNSE